MMKNTKLGIPGRLVLAVEKVDAIFFLLASK